MHILLTFIFLISKVSLEKDFHPVTEDKNGRTKGAVALRRVDFEPLGSSLSSNQAVKFLYL